MDKIKCGQCVYWELDEADFPCCECKGTATTEEEYQKRPLSWCRVGTYVQAETKADAVNSPAHYNAGKFECIDVMLEVFGKDAVKNFCLCNAFKYIWRCNEKHETPTEDVKKAKWYLEKWLELAEDENADD